MAITKTVFTATTQAANAAEVYAFLNANKSGCFDSVTQDESGNITCTVGDVDCLKLGFDGTTKSVKISAANGTSRQGYFANIKWEYAYATSKGLWLYSYALFSATAQYPISIFITNTDSGDTAIVAICDGSSTAEMAFITTDVLNGGVVRRYYGGGTYSSGSGSKIIYPSGVTTLTPIVLTESGTSYTPDLFFTLFTQYRFTPSVLLIGGTRYVYDGRIALRE